MTGVNSKDRDRSAVEAESLELYDFKHPSRLSREQIKRINYLHSSLAKRLSVSLAGQVRDYVEVSVGQVSETHWSMFVDSIPVPCAAITFDAHPLEGTGIINMDLNLAFGLMDRIFGGKGEPIDSQRELTPIEQKVVSKILDTILKEIDIAWSPVANLNSTASGFSSSPEFIQASGFDESLIVVRLTIKTNYTQGEVVIGYPYLMFEPVIRIIASPTPSQRKMEPDREKIADLISVVPLPVCARLRPSMIAMRVLSNLAEGDVLLLDNRVSDQVPILVGNKIVFMGRPGDSCGRLAIKVTRLAREGGIQGEP